jgi:uncharacterized surface protein with fasciclin (FAS1) repeats/outer membrane protein OmpA-like peptidoglycan-associated protein
MVLGSFAAAAVPLVIVSSLVNVPRIEDELTTKTEPILAASGVDGLRVDFSGQDATIRCDAPLGIAQRRELQAEVEGIRGVRVAEFEPRCTSGAPPAPSGTTSPPEATTTSSSTTTSVVPTTAAPEPVAADLVTTLAGNPDYSTLVGLIADADLADTLAGGEFTVFAPTNAAFEAVPAEQLAALQADPDLLRAVLQHHVVPGIVPSADLVAGPLDTAAGDQVTIAVDGGAITVDGAAVTAPDIQADNGIVHGIDTVLLPVGSVAAAAYNDGRYVLTGTVASEGQRQALVSAAGSVVAPENVVDELQVVAGMAIDDDTVARLGQLIAATPPNLVSGEAGWDGRQLYARGVYLDDSTGDAFQAIADAAGASTDLEARPQGAACDTEGLRSQLNSIVVDQPIQFAPGSADIQPASAATLDRVAVVATECAGVVITVEGHTDSDGADATNQSLSERRAQAVLDALVQRGVPEGQLASQGFGETQLLPAGAQPGSEDKVASRRVEFQVVVSQ